MPLPLPRRAPDLVATCPWCETVNAIPEPERPALRSLLPSLNRRLALGLSAGFALAAGLIVALSPPAIRPKVVRWPIIRVTVPAVDNADHDPEPLDLVPPQDDDPHLAESSPFWRPVGPLTPLLDDSLPRDLDPQWEAARAGSARGPGQAPATTTATPLLASPALDTKGVRAERPRMVLVGDGEGRRVVGRVHAAVDQTFLVLLPDGQIGATNSLVPTNASFRPAGMDTMEQELLAGEFRDFQPEKTRHYLILSTASPTYTARTAKLLESLYEGLQTGFRGMGFSTHEAEFPLVVVLDGQETAFRRRKSIPADSQAYYDPMTNRVHLFETPTSDDEAPEIAALRRPQVIAHEGTHQLLQNIGIQPRLAPWPAWLAEGLAEFCAPTMTLPDGRWAGFRKVNPIHMATLRDLADPWPAPGRPGASRARPSIEELLERQQLRPTDYAVAWAMTHYAATRRTKAFTRYLKDLGQFRPLDPTSGQSATELFRAAFGPDLARFDRFVRDHTGGFRGYPELPYFAVYFERWNDQGFLEPEVMVTQSPAIVLQRYEELIHPDWGTPFFRVRPFSTRASALLQLQAWQAGVFD